tara:strand:+ start:801 stop:917 length:117 start_codon:yes stop_codon:yes gene_type:complete
VIGVPHGNPEEEQSILKALQKYEKLQQIRPVSELSYTS